MGRVHPCGDIAGVSGQLSDLNRYGLYAQGAADTARGVSGTRPSGRPDHVVTPRRPMASRSSAWWPGRSGARVIIHVCIAASALSVEHALLIVYFKIGVGGDVHAAYLISPEGERPRAAGARRPAVMRTMATGCAASRRGDAAWIAHLLGCRRLMYEATATASKPGPPAAGLLRCGQSARRCRTQPKTP